MRYLVEPKASNLENYILIKNERGQDVFWVEPRLAVGSDFCLRDMSGREVAIIQTKSPLFGSAFEVYKERQSFAYIKKKMPPFFKHLFHIKIQGNDALIVESDYAYLKYTFHEGERLAATSAQKRHSKQGKYIVDITGYNDHVLILCCTLMFYYGGDPHTMSY